MTNLKITDKFKDSLYPILTFLAIIIVWQAVVEIKDIPQYILPTPIDIIKVFITDYQNFLISHKSSVAFVENFNFRFKSFNFLFRIFYKSEFFHNSVNKIYELFCNSLAKRNDKEHWCYQHLECKSHNNK